MDVVIYTRVSTEDQKENGFSLQDQKRRLVNHCKDFNKNILAHYEDDYSAKDFKRPEFQRMLFDIRTKKISPNQLICLRVDRFSRNLEETLAMVRLLKTLKVEVQYVEQNYDLSTPENKLPHMISLLLPQIENERRGLNTKQGMRQALRQGRWMWKAPKGYDNDKVSKIVRINKDAEFIKRAFIEVANNIKSREQIRRELAKDDFSCSKQQFLNILGNHFYTGHILIDEWKNEPAELVKGLHEAIIDKELFERVQDVLIGRIRNTAKPSKYQTAFPLRGHLICKQCGANLTASSSKGRSKKYDYYHCQHGCKERVEAYTINKTFSDHLNKLQIDKVIAELYKKVMKDLHDQEECNKEKNVNRLNQQIVSLNEKLKGLDEKLLSDVISGDDYKRISGQLKLDLERLNNDKNILEIGESDFEKHFTYGISFLSNLTYYYEKSPIELKHKIIGSIYPEKLIFDGENYRTTSSNSFVDLITSKSVGIELKEKRQAIISDNLSKVAPPLGLEPRTP